MNESNDNYNHQQLPKPRWPCRWWLVEHRRCVDDGIEGDDPWASGHTEAAASCGQLWGTSHEAVSWRFFFQEGSISLEQYPPPVNAKYWLSSLVWNLMITNCLRFLRSDIDNVNVIIQPDPTRPKISASFAAFLFGMHPATTGIQFVFPQNRCGWCNMLILLRVYSISTNDHPRYIASPRFFHSKGTQGMLIPYKLLGLNTWLFGIDMYWHAHPWTNFGLP